MHQHENENESGKDDCCTGYSVQRRWSQRDALPRQRAMANLWKRCLVVEGGCSVSNWKWMVWMVSSARPPSVSATIGMLNTGLPAAIFYLTHPLCSLTRARPMKKNGLVKLVYMYQTCVADVSKYFIELTCGKI